jgi:Ca-activated chloride channel family protein
VQRCIASQTVVEFAIAKSIPEEHPITSHRHTRALVGTLTLLIFGFVTTGGVTGSLAGTAHADGNDPGKLVMVLDSSGSMKEPASGGETKIVAAKKALRSVIAGLPPEQPVGLRVYGATVFARSDAGACTDSRLEVPVAAGNRRQLLAAVGSYKPYGETPIGYALQQAGKDLGSTGKRSIVLVSDGVPTCQPDPCQVAKELVKAGVDLKIDVVGLDVGSRARGALQCIADAGHGTYYDVANSRDFAASLEKVATRAARPYTTIGRPVTGAATAPDAPTITNGDWQDRTDGSEDRYYLIKREQARSTVHFSAAFRDPGKTVFNTVALSTPEGVACDTSGTVEQLATNTLISSAATASAIDTFGNLDADAPCATSSTLVAKVTYSGRTVAVPVEIRVSELPVVENPGSLPKPVEKPRWVAPPSRSPQQVRGGTSFDDAPLLAPGSYRDTVVQGETLTYQVDVDWGQQLNAQVAFPALTDALLPAVEGSPLSKLSVFSPARASAGSTAVGNRLASVFMQKGTTARLATVSGPVAFRNTSASEPGISGSDLAGRYTVTVFLAESPGGRSVPLPFRLDLGVSGTPHGEPVFATAPTSPDSQSPTPSPSGSASDQPASAGAGSGGGSGGGVGGFPTGAVLGGLGALALVAAGVVTLRARGSQA